MRTYELTVRGIRTVVREHGESRGGEAVVFVHGSPGSGADWDHLLLQAGRHTRAIAWDAPGFGQADKPRDFAQTVAGHGDFIGATLAALDVHRVHLCVHDFGGPWALDWAARDPGRLGSLVLIDTGVLLGYRWHALARIWRTPVAGELFMALTTRWAFRLLIGRLGNPRGLPAEFVSRMYRDFDRATRRSVLRLYRSLPDPAGWSAAMSATLSAGLPAAAGAGGAGGAAGAGGLPVLVIWGAHDPYLRVGQAEIQRRTFPHAEVVVLPGSGHWPFADDPEAVDAAAGEFWEKVLTGERSRT
jgi:pimeloyl-ACP methyl ester carboxylesterase